MVLLSLIFNQIIVHAISKYLSPDPLLVICKVFLDRFSHVLRDICFVDIFEDALVLLVEYFGDQDLCLGFFWLLLDRFDGAVEVFQL